MSGKLSGYPVEGTTVDTLARFDMSNWTGAALQSQWISKANLQNAISLNLFNSNLVQDANRNHDSNGFTQSFTNGKQFSMTSAFAPASLGSFEFGGFGTNGSDQLMNIKNGSNANAISAYGDQSVRFSGHTSVNTNTSTAAQIYLFGDNSAYGLLAQGASTVGTIAVDGVSANSPNLFMGIKLNGGKTGIRIQDNVIAATANRSAFVADITGSNTLDNIGVLLDVQNGGGGGAIAIDITNGDIRLPSNALGFTGTGAYTTLTIEKGIITNAV